MKASLELTRDASAIRRLFANPNPAVALFSGLLVILMLLSPAQAGGWKHFDWSKWKEWKSWHPQPVAEPNDSCDVSLDIENTKKFKKRWRHKQYKIEATLTNDSAETTYQGPLQLVITKTRNPHHYLANADGVTEDGFPFVYVDVPDDRLIPGEVSPEVLLEFKKSKGKLWSKKIQPRYKHFHTSYNWKKHEQHFHKTLYHWKSFWWTRKFPVKFRYEVRCEPAVEIADELNVAGLFASPANLVSGAEASTDVTFSVSVSGGDTGAASDVILNNLNDGTQLTLVDTGTAGDEEAGDGIYTGVQQVDSDTLGAYQCLGYTASTTDASGAVVETDPLELCATPYSNRFSEPDTSDPNVVTLGEAQVVANELLIRINPDQKSLIQLEQALMQLDVGAEIVGADAGEGQFQIRFYPYYCYDQDYYDPDYCPDPAESLQSLITFFESTNVAINVTPNYVGEFTAKPSDTRFLAGEQHSLELVSTDDITSERYFWDTGAFGQGTWVILLDSGVTRDHPDGISPRGVDAEKDFNDNIDHGTRMASIVRADTDNEDGIAAIARNTKLRSIRVSGNTKVTLTKMLDAFQRAKDYAGRNRVVSASFSINNMLSDGGVCKKINQIIGRGSIVVVSAGNNNSNAATGIVPGNCNSDAFDPFNEKGSVSSSRKDSLIVVGASSCTSGACDTDNRWTDDSSSVGSNRGSWVDISAPGQDIRVAKANGGYGRSSGTSPAAALVAGAAAVLRGCHVGGDPSSSGDPALDLSAVYSALNLGALTSVSQLPNRMNVYHSLEAVNGAPTELTLSNDSVDDGVDTTGGRIVGDVTVVDPDVCDKYSLEIVGGADIQAFSLGGDLGTSLVLDDGILNVDQKASYEVIVRVTDFFGEVFEQTLIVNVAERPIIL